MPNKVTSDVVSVDHQVDFDENLFDSERQVRMLLHRLS